MKKYTDNILLTKEAFNEYAKQLREEKAKAHGLTLEQWDAAIVSGSAVPPKQDDLPRMW